uniref:Uncharacterized protein n=1 Tax=Rhizophora mucronata TaxID=61149 RepID=A0A2P2PGF3_RHIMU
MMEIMWCTDDCYTDTIMNIFIRTWSDRA